MLPGGHGRTGAGGGQASRELGTARLGRRGWYWSAVFHPNRDGVIYIGQGTGGIGKTTDDGATWTDIAGNCPSHQPQILRFTPTTQELWSGWVGLYEIKQ